MAGELEIDDSFYKPYADRIFVLVGTYVGSTGLVYYVMDGNQSLYIPASIVWIVEDNTTYLINRFEKTS